MTTSAGESHDDRKERPMAQVTTVNSKKQQKRTQILCFVLAGFFIALAALLVVMDWNYMIKGETKDLTAEIANGNAPVKGDYVSLNVSYVLGNYAETKHKRYFITTGTDQHYAVLLRGADQTMCVMSVKLKDKSDIEKLESMVDPTWNFISGQTDVMPMDTITLTGCVSTMDSQIKGFYKEALSGAGVDTADGVTIYELTLDATETRLSKFLIVFGLLAIGGLSILAAFMIRSKIKKIDQLQDIARENAADPSLNPFLQGGAAPQNPYAGGTNAPGVAGGVDPYTTGAAVNAPTGPSVSPYTTGSATGTSADPSSSPYTTGSATGTSADPSSNPYYAGSATDASADPSSNPYYAGSAAGASADSSSNPYYTGSAESDGVLSQYTTADRTNVSDLADTGIDFPGTGSTSSDSIPDSYPDTSIDDYSRE